MNPVTDLANTVGSGALTEATAIMSGPIGYFVFFTIGLAVIGTVVYAIRKWFK